MPGPFNYSLPTPDVGASLTGGIQQGLAIHAAQVQQAMQGLQIQQAQRQLAMQQQADAARQAAIADPSAENVNRLALADPQNWQAINAAHNNLTSDQQRQNTQDAAAAWGYGQNGNWDAMAGVIQRRVDAGQTNLQPILDAVKSGDPNQRKAALATTGVMLSSFMGPDKFAEVYKTTSPQGIAQQQAETAKTQADANKANSEARYHTVSADQALVDTGTPGSGGAPAQDVSQQGQPTQGQGQAPQAQPSQGQSGQQPRGVRNNNPLNITNLPSGQWAGQTGSDGQYAVFSTPLAGWAAADKNLQSYAKNHGINTIAGIVSRWAPESGGNNTAAYIGTVSGDLGVQPNQPLDLSKPEVRQAILQSMSKVELGGQYGSSARSSAQAPQQAAAPASSSAPQSGPQVVAAGPGFTASSMSPQAIEQAAQQYVANGVMPDLGRTPLAGAQKAQIINRAAQIEAANGQTGYDVAARRAATAANQQALTDITKTASAMRTSEQTVLKNMGVVVGLAPKGSGPAGSPLLNKPIQDLRKSVWGSSDVAAFDQAIGSTADEYATVMGKGVPTVQGRNEAYERLSKAANLGQLKSIMGVMRQEMENQATSYENQQKYLTDSIRNSVGSTGSALPQPRTPQEAQKLPPGTAFLAPDGSIRISH